MDFYKFVAESQVSADPEHLREFIEDALGLPVSFACGTCGASGECEHVRAHRRRQIQENGGQP